MLIFLKGALVVSEIPVRKYKRMKATKYIELILRLKKKKKTFLNKPRKQIKLKFKVKLKQKWSILTVI